MELINESTYLRINCRCAGEGVNHDGMNNVEFNVWNIVTSSSAILCAVSRDKKGWTQRVGLANVSPKGYHGIRGWLKLDSGS